MKTSLPLIILFCLGFLGISAQDASIVDGDILVKFQDKINAESFCRDFETNHNKDVKLEAFRCLSQAANIWHLKYDHKDMNQEDILDQVRSHKDVFVAQFNHTNITTRVTVPNDTQYGSMWGLNNTGQSGGTVDADIDAPEAWDITTGGTTTQGDEIVVAVIDGGCDINHEDLVDNLWKNTAEIPGNGIDDDANGYIDDYDGWNAYGNNGAVPSDSHGTHVCGTVGATGNNNQGVTGVNWDVKVMPIAGSSGTESIVIAAYGYVLDARTLYNTSGGTDGAFVVSTNASFGVDFGDPADFPLWCGIYDDLGAEGVLNAGATANQNIDIDVQGDVPTACPSPYMIAVTNTTDTDNKNAGAAYGLTTIDLGAPGTGVLSTLPGDTYGNNTGTSMATPHVAGAVALIMAGACDDFITNYKNDPGTYILELKDAIMDGTDPIADLSGTTVSGGRLNVYNAILELNPGTSGECNPGFALSSTDTEEEICVPANAVYTIDVASLVGFTDPVTLTVSGNPAGTTAGFSSNPVTPGNSTNLTISNTGSAANGNYTITVMGTATGAPAQTLDLGLSVLSSAPGATTLSTPADAAVGVPITTGFTWNPSSGASSYDIEIATDAGFTNIVDSGNSTTTSYTPGSSLSVNTTYHWRVSATNGCGSSAASTAFSFETQSAVYCDSNGNDASEEWIESVEIAGVLNVTGTDGGYADYTSIVIPMDIGTAYPFTLTPDWSGTLYDEYWKVWIDYNGDGTFSDIDEVAYDAGSANQNVQTGNITIPVTVSPGLVRMRISMKYNSVPTSCESFTFGEVEDYTIDIKDPGGCLTDVVETGTYAGGTVLVIESTTYIESDATVANNANITYDSTDDIDLLAGFTVDAGGEFLALIEGCGGATTLQEEEDESK